MIALIFLVLAFCLGATSFENGSSFYALMVFVIVALAGVIIGSAVEAVMKELLAPFVWHMVTRLRVALLPARPRRSHSGPSS